MFEKITLDTEKPKLRQMNLRVRDDVRKCFKQFCAEHEVTQSEALRLLLAQSDCSVSGEMLNSIEAELRDAKEKNEELQERIDDLRSNHESANHRCIEYASVVRKALHYVLDKTSEKELKHPPLKRDNIKYWVARSEYRTHSYPKSSGCCLFTVESIMYGKGRSAPLFITGTNEAEEAIKFRFYTKKEHIGFDIRNKDFGYKGAEWLMGYMIAKDGAADLILSIPLDALWRSEDQRNIDPEEKPFLDHIIFEANQKKCR